MKPTMPIPSDLELLEFRAEGARRLASLAGVRLLRVGEVGAP